MIKHTTNNFVTLGEATQFMHIITYLHEDNFIVKITMEFCNQKIDRSFAIIYYPFVSYMIFKD